jgi:hypothetical protein
MNIDLLFIKNISHYTQLQYFVVGRNPKTSHCPLYQPSPPDTCFLIPIKSPVPKTSLMGCKICPIPNLPLGGTEQYTIIVASSSKYKTALPLDLPRLQANLSAFMTRNKV